MVDRGDAQALLYDGATRSQLLGGPSHTPATLIYGACPFAAGAEERLPCTEVGAISESVGDGGGDEGWRDRCGRDGLGVGGGEESAVVEEDFGLGLVSFLCYKCVSHERW